jgi:hypothetical protein
MAVENSYSAFAHPKFRSETTMRAKQNRIPPVIAMLLATVSAVFSLTQNTASSSPASDDLPAVDQLRIVHGPVLENVTDATAIIAWSTNANAGTVLHYGTDPDRLDRGAGMPWGGLTHRIELHDLKPGTTYYFRAESPHGQGTGADVESPLLQFRTRPSH